MKGSEAKLLSKMDYCQNKEMKRMRMIWHRKAEEAY